MKLCRTLASILPEFEGIHLAGGAGPDGRPGRGEVERLLGQQAALRRRVARRRRAWSKIGKISKILQIFGGLVLGCTSNGARPQARARSCPQQLE